METNPRNSPIEWSLASHSTTVFFRDDDVGRLSAGLRAVLQLLVAEGIPCNYRVVPSFLDEEAAGYLRELQSRHPDRIVLNQHGHRHEQQLAGRLVYSEFAGNRPYADQYRDIAEGRARLQTLLGASFDASIFTPPCHKYDEQTLRALHALGFSVLSAGVKLDLAARSFYAIGRALGRIVWLGQRVSYHGGRSLAPPLADVSVCIDVDEDKDAAGARIEKDSARLVAEFERARRRTPWVGVMLHHELYTAPARVETLRAFIRHLKADPGVAFATIGAIAGGAVASGRPGDLRP